MYFPCPPTLPASIDQSVREALADSLANLYSVAPAPFESANINILEALKEIRAHGVEPGLFGRYYELVFALQEGRMEAAAALCDDIGALARRRPSLEVTPFTEAALGEDVARYSRLLEIAGLTPDLIACPSAEQAADFRRIALAALDLLDAADAGLAIEMRALVKQIVDVGPPPKLGGTKFGGVTSFMLWGAVFLNVDRHLTPLDMLEGLVHETSHHLLFGLAERDPLTSNPLAICPASPLRDGPRPVDGVLHATFVCARLHYLYRRLLDVRPDALDKADLDRAQARLLEFRQRFLDGQTVLLAHAELTAAGAEVLSDCAVHVANG